jgi:hypothetical protein
MICTWVPYLTLLLGPILRIVVHDMIYLIYQVYVKIMFRCIYDSG